MEKAELRVQKLAQRLARSAVDRANAAEAIAAHVLAQPIITRAHRVAAYVSMDTEPGTAPMIEALRHRGIEVIVPISLADGTLDWVVHSPDAELSRTSLGIIEPAGERLGAGALSSTDLLIVPALAVDHAGHRLGRGAGYYDRALANASVLTCALLFSDEIVDELPHEPHDIGVDMVITPAGVFRVP